MDEVAQHVHCQAAGVGPGVDPVDLVVVAVHERDPGACLVRVAPGGALVDIANARERDLAILSVASRKIKQMIN